MRQYRVIKAWSNYLKMDNSVLNGVSPKGTKGMDQYTHFRFSLWQIRQRSTIICDSFSLMKFQAPLPHKLSIFNFIFRFMADRWLAIDRDSFDSLIQVWKSPNAFLYNTIKNLLFKSTLARVDGRQRRCTTNKKHGKLRSALGFKLRWLVRCRYLWPQPTVNAWYSG